MSPHDSGGEGRVDVVRPAGPGLILGGAGFAKLGRDAVAALIEHAIDRGVNTIDSSPFYGLGRSEEVLGQALRSVGRDRVVLATKCGRYGQQDFDFSAKRVRSSLVESCRRLGIDHVDVFQLHDVDTGWSHGANEVAMAGAAELVRLRDVGDVRAIGATGYEAEPLIELASTFDLDVVMSFCRGFVLDDSMVRDLVPELAPELVAVWNASPLGMGLLSPNGPIEGHPANDPMLAAGADLAARCHHAGVEVVELALRFALGLPGVRATVTGASSIAELDQAIDAAKHPLDSDMVALVGSVKPAMRQRRLEMSKED